jgi:hypothetical protein
MPIGPSIAPYVLDHGIADIVYGEPDAPTLPEQKRLLPWELGHVPELSRVLSPGAQLDDWLTGVVMPLVEQEVLEPARFRKLVKDAKDKLRAGATTVDPESARKLNACARLLETQGELDDLFNFYWRALVQG